MGFEPTPLRTGALSQRLRPLGQTVSVAVSADAAAALQVFVRVLVRGWCTSLLLGGRVIAPGFSLRGGANAVANRRPRTNAANPSRPCANDGATRLANRCCRAAPQAGTTASKRTGRPTVETTSCSATRAPPTQLPTTTLQRAEARSCTADASRKPGAANTPHPVGPATGLRAARYAQTRPPPDARFSRVDDGRHGPRLRIHLARIKLATFSVLG